MLLAMTSSTMTAMLFSGLMFLVQVQGDDVVRERPSRRTSCPKGYFSYFSYCYALYNTPTTWMDAELTCQKQRSGHLVSVLSGSEASFVTSMINSNFNNYKYIWIGLHDPTEGCQLNGGGWNWSSNDALNYHAWEETPTLNSNAFCGTVSQNSVQWTGEDDYRF
ncbi:lithostathine-like [Sorex araneus]|uniref:lithostathine-like n=1 Tax=Sorex araneus TaxID=42254 RepID=UPI00064A892D|nr:lithostathine-like [Sorex araneus]